jgi:hypothetical protein
VENLVVVIMVLPGYEKGKNFETSCNAMRKNIVAVTVTLTGERSVSVLLGLF